jgi:hypothetical protein
VLSKRRAVAIAVVHGAAQSVLFVGEQHDANRAPWSQLQRLQQPPDLPRRDRPSAIVSRAGANVPGIEVAADDDDLVRPLAPAHFRDDVRRLDVGVHGGIHRQAETHSLAPRGHACQTRRVFPRNRRRRDPRHTVAIDQHAGVRRAKAFRPNRSNERRDRAGRRRL